VTEEERAAIVDRFNRVELADLAARRRERIQDAALLAIVVGLPLLWWLAGW
jgi:hypothetical protein